LSKTILKIFFVFAFILFQINSIVVYAQDLSTSDGSKYITVEAEGSGATKLEALNSAWSEAVKKAIGLYMVSKTSVIDEDIEEKILVYSRGRVNSYKEISSNKVNDIWLVKIEAEIEKEILIETVNAYSTSELPIDGLNLAATLSTDSEKELNKTLLLKDFFDSFTYEDLFKITLKPLVENGQLYVLTTIELDYDVYRNLILGKLNNILEQISISKENKFLNGDNVKCNKFLITNTYKFHDNYKLPEPTCNFFQRGNYYYPNDELRIVIYDVDRSFDYIIRDDLFQLINHMTSIYSNNQRFELLIQINALQVNEIILTTTYLTEFYFVLSENAFNHIAFKPGFNDINNSIFTRIATFKIPFDIDSDTLSKITSLKASLTFIKK
jgi:hypothetical protein